MKGLVIKHAKRILLFLIVSLSVIVLICQSGSGRGFWAAADRFIYSIEKVVYPVSILAEITAPGLVDLQPSDAIQGTPSPEPSEIPGINQTDFPKIDRTSTRYYVSKFGDNSNGLAWDTAWNELDQIKWEMIEPGDTILLDGGQTELVYSTQLTITKSGVYGMPVTIKVATESGRNGQVVIFGGRNTPLPYCGQDDYVYQDDNVGKIGVLIDNASWIVIDGTRWSGIVIHGHNEHGIQLNSGSANITMRNIEIHDNGTAEQREYGWFPDSAGIFFSGSNLTFERFIVHDNGQDALQSEGGIENFILRQSWLYNARRHPTTDESFNYCSHTDGLQIYNGGQQSGFLIEETIIGPGFTNGLILGSISGQTYAVIDHVILRDVLLSKAADNNILAYPDTQPQGWILDHVTLDCTNTKYECFYLAGSDHQVLTSIFWGARIQVPTQQIESKDNCQWETTGSTLGAQVDPLFEDASGSDPFSLDNYTLLPESPCEGLGSRLTSVGQLFGQKDPDRLLEGSSWRAEQAYFIFPFILNQGTIFQKIETDHPALGGRASFRFEITTPGEYIVKIKVNAPDTSSNSFYVNIDDEPTSPDMIWDIGVTHGFEEREVSWRGSGTDLDNQFSPKVFKLDSGLHELIIVGRESNAQFQEVDILRAYRIQDSMETNSSMKCCRIRKKPAS